ncbi:MAG: ABC transporter substrate-binding protein [Alphaproteobacteria bacterium]
MNKCVLFLMVILSLASCKKDEFNNGKQTIKVGAILPLSGDSAIWGHGVKNGIELAFDDISEKTKYNYKFIVEDNTNTNKSTQAIAKKLLHVDKVNAIITVFDPTANIVAPLASQNKVIHFGSSWFPQFINYEYSFNIYSNIYSQAQLMKSLLQSQRASNVVLFTVNQSGFLAGSDVLKEELSGSNINVCKEIRFNFGQKDFLIDIAKLMDCVSSTFVINAFSPELDIIVRQLKQVLGNNIKFTGFDLGLNVDNYELLKGSTYPTIVFPNEAFINKYITKFNDYNYMYGSGIGYVEIKILVDAFENIGNGTAVPNTEDVSAYIKNKSEIKGVFGDMETDGSGNIFIPVGLMEI